MRLKTLLFLACVAAFTVGSVPSQPRQRTFVIVHGAWGGGWDWRAVDSMITSHGDRVERVTLTGLGERVHLASPEIGLETHIADVVNTIVWEDLRDVILVGHSYGGMVITGAADRVPDRIRRVVYVDAFLPDSGETMFGLAGPAFSWVSETVRSGMSVPSWADTSTIPRDVPQPYRTFTDTLRLSNPAARRIPGTFILTFEPARMPDAFQPFADRAAARGWPVYRIQASHTPERDAREPLVKLLREVP